MRSFPTQIEMKASFIWRAACLLLMFSGVCALAGEDNEQLKTQLTVQDVALAKSASNAYRILFIGDSITRHGTNPDLKQKLGWDHIAGMAASSEENDFVHLLAKKIQTTMPDRKVEIYFDSQARPLHSPKPNDFELGSAAEKVALLESRCSFDPHLVVIQLGEHERANRGEDFFRKSYEELLSHFTGQNPPPKILCTGVWAAGDASKSDPYLSGWNATVESVVEEICRKHGIPFASVKKYALDPECHGTGQSEGVRWHPNDRGHQGYADALFEAYQLEDKNSR